MNLRFHAVRVLTAFHRLLKRALFVATFLVVAASPLPLLPIALLLLKPPRRNLPAQVLHKR